MAELRYRIGAAARFAGMTTHAIRVWERRYGILKPDRSQGGARLYSDAELDHLRLLKRAVDSGHAISQIAGLDRGELERLGGGQVTPLPVFGNENTAGLVEEFLKAVRGFDAVYAERLLERASVMFSPRSLVLDVLSPLLVRIGSDWAAGTLCTASEHVASALVRERATLLLRQLTREPGSETVVVTTPAGELHELGAMLAAATAAMQGYAVLYLGPNLPASEIAIAARASSAEVVALSVVGLDVSDAVQEIRELTTLLPDQIDLVLGGPFAGSIAEEVGARVVSPGNLGDFESWLGDRRRRVKPVGELMSS